MKWQNKHRDTASILTHSEIPAAASDPTLPPEEDRSHLSGSERTPSTPTVACSAQNLGLDHQNQLQGEAIGDLYGDLSTTVNIVVVEEFRNRFEKPKTNEFIALIKM
ncbi:hypothetical protein ACSBR2_016910 [Camellia fascicularis]